MIRGRLLLCCFLFLALGQATWSCSKNDDDRPEEEFELVPSDPPPVQIVPISPQEAKRGRLACGAYVARLCGCAEAQEGLKESCELARATPSALDMNLRAAEAAGNATSRDRVAIIHSARQIMRNCVEAEVRLDDVTCPRPDSNVKDDSGP